MAVEFRMIEEAADGDVASARQHEEVVLVGERAAVVERHEDGRAGVGVLCRIARQADDNFRSFAGPVNRQHEMRVVQGKLNWK